MITIEIYEEDDDEPLAYLMDVATIPRIGERIYLRRVPQITGKDPKAEHPYFKVVHVEHHYDITYEYKPEYGRITQVAVIVTRENESLWRY